MSVNFYQTTRTAAKESLTCFGEMETLRREEGKKELLIKQLGGFKINCVGNEAIEVKLDRIEKKPDKKP
jgi:hypothetical protein